MQLVASEYVSLSFVTTQRALAARATPSMSDKITFSEKSLTLDDIIIRIKIAAQNPIQWRAGPTLRATGDTQMSAKNPIRVCVAGVTGWVGSILAPAVLAQKDMTLTSAVARKVAGKTVGEALSGSSDVRIRSTVAEAIEKDEFDVLVDYTSVNVVFDNASAAVAAGKNVVIGTSGISPEQLRVLDTKARERNVGLLVGGNFAITAVLAQVFACCAAKYIDSWEIVEYGPHSKKEAPGWTAQELATRLTKSAAPKHPLVAESVIGDVRARGATVGGTQVHSIRVPGFVMSFETILGSSNEQLTIRHDSGIGAEPYIAGTLLAVREIGKIKGARDGLDSIMDLKLT
jgi:4-hydroxy-tetrahydrodipicolinate reductase